MATGTVDNLIQGTGYLYWAPLGTSEPADTAITSEPSGDWVNLGFTKEGVELQTTQEFSELEVDQLVFTAERRLMKVEYKIVTNLAEATLDNFKRALNGGTVTDVDADTGTPGYSKFEPLTDPTDVDYGMLIFDGLAPSGFPRRVIVRKALQVGDVNAKYAKDGQLVFPVEFAAHYVSSSVKPFKIVDQTADAQ